jgi:protein-S-isoprenylcysteine O-methyltransferase Ste14
MVLIVDGNARNNWRGLQEMSPGNFERYLIGYMTGFTIFFLAVPYIFYVMASLFDIHLLDHWARFIIAVPLLILGLIFAVWSNVSLMREGKGGPTDLFNVAISPRTRHLVVTGPYRYTRNPMVFGAFCCYFALSIYLNSLVDLIMLIIFFVAVKFYLEETEERRLWKDFGKEYEEYRRQVPMIVPLAARKRKNRES